MHKAVFTEVCCSHLKCSSASPHHHIDCVGSVQNMPKGNSSDVMNGWFVKDIYKGNVKLLLGF